MLRKGEHPTIYDEDDDDENINNDETSGTQNWINDENDKFKLKQSKDNKIKNFTGDISIKSTQDEKTCTKC